MIAGRRNESSQRRRARCTTARRSAMPSRHYAGTAQAAARPAAFLRIGGGGEAGLFGLFGQAFAKAEARPNAACRRAVCAGRKAVGALARAPKPERTGRPAAGGTVCARAGPKAAAPTRTRTDAQKKRTGAMLSVDKAVLS